LGLDRFSTGNWAVGIYLGRWMGGPTLGLRNSPLGDTACNKQKQH
jgi:hypothetical protein